MLYSIITAKFADETNQQKHTKRGETATSLHICN